MTAPLQMSFDVDCSAEHAFNTWTSGIATKTPEPVYGFDRNGCTDSIGILTGIAPGGFPRPARRTRRAARTAPGSPRALPAGLAGC